MEISAIPGGPVEIAAGPHHNSCREATVRATRLSFCRNADCVLYAALFHRLVDLRLGEGRVGPEHNFFAHLLLPLNLRQEQVIPVVGAAAVAGPQLCSQTVALPIQQQQRVVAGRLEVAIVGALLLPAVHLYPGRVHAQYDPTLHIEGLGLADEFAVDAGKLRKFSSSASISVSKVCKREVSAAPRSQVFSEPIHKSSSKLTEYVKMLELITKRKLLLCATGRENLARVREIILRVCHRS